MDVSHVGELTIAAYSLVLALLCVYGAHRLLLVATFLRVRGQVLPPDRRFSELPCVTIQLPLFNEPAVVERVIAAAARVDYPRDRLEIQVLDDSTDETQALAQAQVAALRAAGHDIVYLHRSNRAGYKAGALAAGTLAAKGELIAIFDADFVPPPQVLRETVHFFTAPRVGMVQCRWDHLNRDDSLLTQSQAILLDGHFVIEHTARNRSGCFMSFNGTAGIWRRAAIEDAGGWQHDTLTEDLDLSYRAQLRGWQFVFLPELAAPAELPPEMNAFKAQQHRWTKGGAQTCAKLLGRVLREAPSGRVRMEAFLHLTSGFVYILMLGMTLLLGPALIARAQLDAPTTGWQLASEMLVLMVGLGSALAFYVASQLHLLRGWRSIVTQMPAMMAIGVGIAFNNALAALEGFFSKSGEFVRTPKFGGQRPALAAGPRLNWKAWAELGIAAYLAVCLVLALRLDADLSQIGAALPFLIMFLAGYLIVGTQSLGWRRAAVPAASAA